MPKFLSKLFSKNRRDYYSSDSSTSVEDLDMDKPLIDSSDEEVDFDNVVAPINEDDFLYEIEVVELTKEGNEPADPSQFELLKVIGKGTFGKVFLVRKVVGEDEGTLYAMKVLKKATLKIRDRAAAKREKTILNDVKHPFITDLHYAFKTDGNLYLILDFVQGGYFFTRLKKEVMFTEDNVKFYLAELALALEHIHSLGIIYRDLKPENILLDNEGHISLTDFGLSKQPVDGDNQRAFSFCDVVEYMAPEVISRKGHTFASDWWSYGVLMFEMLTGALPFRGTSNRDTMTMILKSKLGMPQYLTLEAQAFLRILFKRNPDNRLGSASIGIDHLKNHPFFRTINWEKLYNKQLFPPFKPHVLKAEDTSNFDDSPSTPLSANSREIFQDFSFVAPSLLGECQAQIEYSAGIGAAAAAPTSFELGAHIAARVPDTRAGTSTAEAGTSTARAGTSTAGTITSATRARTSAAETGTSAVGAERSTTGTQISAVRVGTSATAAGTSAAETGISVPTTRASVANAGAKASITDAGAKASAAYAGAGSSATDAGVSAAYAGAGASATQAVARASATETGAVPRSGAAAVEGKKGRESLRKMNLVKTTPIREDYEILEEIGRGSFSVCHRCVNKTTREEYAVKIVDRSKRDCKEEVEILMRLRYHPNIVTLMEVYEENNYVYLIMGLLRGRELFEKLMKYHAFSEREAANIMYIVISTVYFLHHSGIVHRDLKPSNLVYATPNGGSDTLTICDFGFAKQLRGENGLLMTPCYTANFAAPEVLKRQGYDAACDIWSLGVILFTLLAGYTPFAKTPGDTTKDILERINNCKLDLESGNWGKISTEGKDLVRKMLCPDPQKRPTAGQLLHSPWFYRRRNLPTTKLLFQDMLSMRAAVDATYRAFSHSSRALELGPVVMSELARRRRKPKPKS